MKSCSDLASWTNLRPGDLARIKQFDIKKLFFNNEGFNTTVYSASDHGLTIHADDIVFVIALVTSRAPWPGRAQVLAQGRIGFVALEFLERQR